MGSIGFIPLEHNMRALAFNGNAQTVKSMLVVFKSSKVYYFFDGCFGLLTVENLTLVGK